MSVSDPPPVFAATPAAADRPHAFDPATQPELFEGVILRRFVAFLIDVTIIFAPIVLAWILFAVLSVLTLGLGLVLFWLIGPLTVVWALAYAALTLGGPNSATIGMRTLGVEMRTWYGGPMYPLLAMVHMVLFYVTVSVLTPFVLLVALFNGRRRFLHDFLCGTVVVNSVERASALRIAH